jgi:asparagine synthase (glutamine-hydrolysing)
MDRFVAMVWDETDPSRLGQVNAWSEILQRRSPKWKRMLDRPGLRVFSYHHRGDHPVVTRWQNDEGIVIGVLFERGQENKGRVQRLDCHATARVTASDGKELIRGYWGNYVALWRDPGTHMTTVLRDPFAAVACFMTRQNGVELLFADVEDVADLPGLAFTIDWTFLKAFLIWQYFATRHTGLNEIKEVQAGQRMEIAPDGEKSFSWAWNAAEIAADVNPQDFDAAKAELRETAEACFTGWGREYRNILVRVSGGIDSSIVLNLVSRFSDARITAHHLVGVDYEAYELKLARLAAAMAGVTLLEPDVPVEADLRRMLDVPRLARPVMQMMSSEASDVVARDAAALGADCVMGGHGGDQLFMQRGGGGHMLADYLQLKGLSPGFWRVAYETAVLTRRSTWKAIGDAIDSAILRRRWNPYAFLNEEGRNRDRLLTEEVVQLVDEAYFLHPWLPLSENLPRGAAGRVQEIVGMQEYHSRLATGAPRDTLYPLVCQPLAEFALRTPSYILGKDGLDRAVERRAFEDLVPGEILRRTNKGGTMRTVLAHWKQNLPFCRDLILGGAFAAHNWIDVAKAETMLTQDYVTSGKGGLFLHPLVVVEAWVARWRGSSMRAAA